MPIIGIGAGFANSTGSILAASGSIGKNFVSMSLEDTASLGLSGSINTFTASINTVTSHTTSSYEFSHIENSLKFLTAKVYENTDKISKSYTENQRYYGINRFNRTILTPGITGNAGTVTNGVYTTGNQTIAGTKTFSSLIAGSINGNAATATQLRITEDNTGDTTNSILFTNSPGTANRSVFEDSSLTYNNTNNILNCTTFNGNLTGTATSASFAFGYKGSSTDYWLTPTDFQMTRNTAQFATNGAFLSLAARTTALCTFTLPIPSNIHKKIFRVTTSGTGTCALIQHSKTGPFATPATIASGNTNTSLTIVGQNWNPNTMYLCAVVTAPTNASIRLNSAYIGFEAK